MPSKKKSFEILSLDRVVELINESESLLSIQLPNEFIEKILMEKISKDYTKVIGTDFTLDFIEQELLSVGLFGNSGPYLIYDSQLIKKQIFEVLASNIDLIQDRVIFISTGKLAKGVPKEIDSVEVTAPKPWHFSQYLDLFCANFGFNLSVQEKVYLERSLEADVKDYFNAVHILSHHVDENGKIGLDKVKKLVKSKKLDIFDQADLLNQNNFKKFYLNLLVVEEDFDMYRSFFSFMQGHISKIIDGSYMKSKKKLSKYDRGIQQASVKWSKEDLVVVLDKFIGFEVLAKSKSQWLRDELRREYLSL